MFLLKIVKGAWRCSSAAGCLSSMHEALGTITSSTNLKEAVSCCEMGGTHPPLAALVDGDHSWMVLVPGAQQGGRNDGFFVLCLGGAQRWAIAKTHPLIQSLEERLWVPAPGNSDLVFLLQNR